jgi:hypothetical protein
VAVMSHDTTDVSENIWCQITQKVSKTDTYGRKLVPLTNRWLVAVMSYDTTDANENLWCQITQKVSKTDTCNFVKRAPVKIDIYKGKDINLYFFGYLLNIQ